MRSGRHCGVAADSTAVQICLIRILRHNGVVPQNTRPEGAADVVDEPLGIFASVSP